MMEYVSVSSSFEEFLKRNSIAPIDGSLPFVHSTKSHNLRKLIESAKLEPTQCNVYHEDLLYFFLGRPSYRWVRPNGTPQDWELPTCFVFDEIEDSSIRRVLPFDSGAHSQNRYPSYIQNIERENFESGLKDSAERVVSAFFGSFKNYVEAKPKNRKDIEVEFSLGPLDTEVLAVAQLAGDRSAPGVDDRRFSIEIQSIKAIDFSILPPSAVILPTPYLKDARVRAALDRWNTQIITYDTFGLSLESYFGQIFLKFAEFLKSRGML